MVNFRLWPLYTRERTPCTLHVLEKKKPLSRIGIRPPERPYRSLVDIRTMSPPTVFMLAVSNDSGICTKVFFFTVYSLLIRSHYFN